MNEEGAVTFIISEDGTCTYLMTEAAPVIGVHARHGRHTSNRTTSCYASSSICFGSG
jgi:hypothetical protein